MSVEPGLEAPRTPDAEGFSDAVTFSFADVTADVYGVARVGLSPDAEGVPSASGLALLFHGGVPVAARAAGGMHPEAAAWEAVDVAGVRTAVAEPLRGWTVAFTGEDPAFGFDLRFDAIAPPAELAPGDPVAVLGGMSGYESMARVQGTARVAGRTVAVDGLGQRGHSWGAPDWDRLSLARTVSVWLDDHTAVSLSALREQRATAHDGEVISAALVEPDEDGPGGPLPHPVAEALLSTTYDGNGCQRSASLELYLDPEEGFARRAAGEVVCGTTLDLGRLRLDCAFMTWRMEGRVGAGRYDLLRRA